MKVCHIPMRPMRPILAACVLAMLTFRPAFGAETTADALRLAFLECENLASSALLGSADAGRCSLVYEQFLRREFQGDFAKLLAWWQAQRRGRAAAPPPLTAPALPQT